MGVYTVNIKEILETQVTVKADNEDIAKDAVTEKYENGEIVLGYDDFSDLIITVEEKR